MQPILNVRRSDGSLVSTGYAPYVAWRLDVPLDGLLDLLLAHGYCRIKHDAYGIYWVTFRSAKQ